MPAATPTLAGISIFERGWLSSNNVLLHGGSAGAVLIDASHVLHSAQTVALVGQALGGEALDRVVNTHLHSDHCGGNAALQHAFGCSIAIPPGQWEAVMAWDEMALGYASTGQRCGRFVPQSRIAPGEMLEVGPRRWQVLAAPGHDPHSIVLFDANDGVLISADALWENGFGIVFPELEGESAFDDVASLLELIDSLDARCVIPGHGAAFTDASAAVQRARQRLAAFRAEPSRHARHAVKALLKYHLLEEQQQEWPALLAWFGSVSFYRDIWLRLGRPEGSLEAFAEHIVKQLAAAGVLALRDGVVHNA